MINYELFLFIISKFLSWTQKLNEDNPRSSINFEKLNKTIMGDRDQNAEDSMMEDTIEVNIFSNFKDVYYIKRMKSIVNGKRINRHSSVNRTTIDG